MPLFSSLILLLAFILALDAMLGLFFGRRYVRWAGSLLPDDYQTMLEEVLEKLPYNLRLIALLELLIAVGLYWLAWKLVGF